MFYEAIEHTVKKVDSPKQAAELIKSGNVLGYEALCWSSPNGTFYAVNNSHTDDITFGEAAIIKQHGDLFVEKDTITCAWVNSLEKLEKYFTQAETSEFNLKTTLIIGKATNETANFTCGCCGSWFRGSVKEQIAFDQDAGYGICPKCSKYYL